MNEEEPENALSKLLRKYKEATELQNKLDKNVTARLDGLMGGIEKNTLMQLWADVGNSSFEYYANMQAIGMFVKSLKATRRVTALPLELGLMVQKALAECAAADYEAMKAIWEEKEKLGIE